MIVIYKNQVYSNRNLKIGDEVYPLSNGKVYDKIYSHESYDFSYLDEEAHIIENLDYSSYKPYQIATNIGYGPMEKYYKLIMTEQDLTQLLEQVSGGIWTSSLIEKIEHKGGFGTVTTEIL